MPFDPKVYITLVCAVSSVELLKALFTCISNRVRTSRLPAPTPAAVLGDHPDGVLPDGGILLKVHNVTRHVADGGVKEWIQ